MNDFRNLFGHTLTGLPTGEMILAAGYDRDTYVYTKEVWILKDDIWSSLGSLQKVLFLRK